MIRRSLPTAQLGLSFEDPQPVRRIWPVRELVGHVRELIEDQFGDVWVEGEISNFRPAPSGHLYFTLKDADAQLPVVFFRRQALLLRFRPGDGLHVLVRGKVSVYDQRGQMQLVAETMEPVGAGSLQLAFEQLKQKLKDEGMFDAERKRPLPAFPRTVGIITSPTGAVIRDFLNVAGRRHSGLNILLCPASVQGDVAVSEIQAAIETLNASGMVDVIVIARGGGSLEDLAAFNSERLARAIAASKLPVVSAIGHETDFTIADFVADLRAPTPSAAAELITTAQHRIAEHVATQAGRLTRAAQFQLLHAQQSLHRVSINRAEARVTTILHRLEQRLDENVQCLEAHAKDRLRALHRQVDDLCSSVMRHDPRQALAHARQHLVAGGTRLDRSMERTLHDRRSQINSLAARLHSLSPLAVLERGYSLVLDEQGELIRSTSQVTTHQRITTRLSDGSFTSRVESVDSAPSPMKREQ